MRCRLAAVLGALGLVALLLLRDAVFGGRVLFERDVHVIWLAQVEAFVRAVGAGAWPLWDPSVAFGVPLLADPSAQVAYPPAWLNLLLPPAQAYTAYALSHLLFSAVGLYALARTFGLSRLSACAGALAWEASGPLLSLVNVWHHFGGAVWIPWVLAAGHRFFVAPGPWRAVHWGAAFGGQILAGSADMCAMTAMVALADGVRHLRFRAPTSPHNRSLLRSSALAVALALGLTAVQWMPTLEVARRSARWGLPSEMRTAWSVHPLAMLQVIVPVRLHELPLEAALQETLVGAREPFLLSLYLGLPALAFVVAAARRPHARFAALLCLGGALMALGRHAPFYGLAVGLLPPLQILRYPTKAMIVSALGWALLVAIGTESWRAAPSAAGGRHGWRFAAFALGTSMAVLAALLPLLAPGLLAAAFQEDVRSTLAVALRPWAGRAGVTAGLAVAMAALALARRRSATLATAVAVAVTAADLTLAHLDLNPTAPASLFKFRSPVVDVVRTAEHPRLYVYEYQLLGGRGHLHLDDDDPAMARRLQADPYATRLPFGTSEIKTTQALALQAYLVPPLPGRWGITGAFDVDIRGLYPAPLADLTRLLRAVEETPAHSRLLQLGGVTHVAALHDRGFESHRLAASIPALFRPDIRVFEVPHPLPRAYVVQAARRAEGEEALRALIDPEFDPVHEVVLDSGPDFRPGLPGAALAPAAGQVRVLSERPDRILLEAELHAPGYVVLLDGYDPGWRATIDGRGTPLLRANVAFRAVAVPPGRHVIEQVYRPRSVKAGAVASAATLTAVLLAVFLGRRRRGRSGPAAW